MSKLIDGLKIAEESKKNLMRLTQDFTKNSGVRPGLAAVRIGDNPSSLLYVKSKGLQAKALGFHFEEHSFPSQVHHNEIEDRIHSLNSNDSIHGIILQLPLPEHLDKLALLSSLDPKKDVDGLHPENAGKLFQGIKGGFIPCTPLGCLHLIKSVRPNLEGLNACMIGTSILVGRPMALLLLQHRCTVYLANSKTRDLPTLCKTADILVVAIGKPNYVQGSWVKEGATVIDVGINKLPSGDLTGDVDFEQAILRAGAITPVPKGVGPMTVVSLLRNTLDSAYQHEDLHFPL